MISNNRPCSPTTLESCHMALQLYGTKYELPRDCDLESLSSRILNGSPSPELETSFGSSSKDFIADWVVVTPNEKGNLVCILGDFSEEGADKKMAEGWLATATKVDRVAFLETKARRCGPESIDWNANELANLNTLKEHPTPGCVKVILTHPMANNRREGTQFYSIQKLYDGDLFGVVCQTSLLSQIPQPYISTMQSQLAAAVKEIHNTRKWVHRDLKPENILIRVFNPKFPDETIETLLTNYREETEITLDICDFAYAADPNDPKCQFLAGSPAYVPPEIAHFALTMKSKQMPGDTAISPMKADIWSLGLILLCLEYHDLFLAIIPFHEIPDHATEFQKKRIFFEASQQYFLKKHIPQFPEPDDKTSKLHMIWRMLQIEPNERPSIEEVEQIFCRPSADIKLKLKEPSSSLRASESEDAG